MTTQLKEDATAIWKAGVDSVLPGDLIRKTLRFRLSEGEKDAGTAEIVIGEESFSLPPDGRVIVVGMGKASGRMAEAVEEILQPLAVSDRLVGWVNVPADVLLPLERIHLHAGRPAGVNEPTEEGVIGSRNMVALLESARPDDLILALISGGGSALAPLPIPGITLEEKGAVTRFLSGAGANIAELNTVRKELSLLKGGGMRRLCRGKRLAALILSDVLGDPLDVIASGATVENSTTAADALEVLDRFGGDRRPELVSIRRALLEKMGNQKSLPLLMPEETRWHRNLILANNASAVDAAAEEAHRLGYHPFCLAAHQNEGEVETVAVDLWNRIQAEAALEKRDESETPRRCALVSGGEPVVALVPPERRGRGGRNSQLVLIALLDAFRRMERKESLPRHFVFLSGGTDGEDGPTDAAGALIDEEDLRHIAESEEARYRAEDHLARNDAYSFFEETGGLFKTGPTGTNVCDVRVILWEDF